VQISCSFPPSLETPEYAAVAEDLGYHRAWLYDSPALYHDIWVTLARVAERTERIGLGTAVLVPNNRHPLVTASAIATIEDLAPGRLAVAIGTGFTGRMAMGKRALPWSFVAHYVRQVRALLAGDTVEVDGARCRMIHPDGFAPPRPIDVPFVIAANGPKGIEVARELGDGIMTIGGGQPEFEWCAVLAFGTVLDDGETFDSPRVVSAAGAGVAVVYHGMYEGDPAAVEALPNGAAWRADIEQIPADERHLAVHEGHLVRVSERDTNIIDPSLIPAFTWSGSTAEIRARVEGAAASGVTEIVYQPIGESRAEIARELRAFREAASA
jgi:5,10-methylenetetrahydromethanopterin reductase